MCISVVRIDFWTLCFSKNIKQLNFMFSALNAHLTARCLTLSSSLPLHSLHPFYYFSSQYFLLPLSFSTSFILCVPPPPLHMNKGCDHISTKLHLLFQKYTMRNFCLCVYLCPMRSWKQLNPKFHKFLEKYKLILGRFQTILQREKKHNTPWPPQEDTFLLL